MKFGQKNNPPERIETQRARHSAYVERQRNKSQGLAQSGRPRQKPTVWAWAFAGQSGKVTAFTRSQARSQVKEILGVKRLEAGSGIITQA